MTTPKKTKTARIAELQRQLKEALAGQAHTYHFAAAGLEKASTQHLVGSGVVLTLTVLGGRELFSPVLLRDGLSDPLIAALRADFARGYELATRFKPKA